MNEKEENTESKEGILREYQSDVGLKEVDDDELEVEIEEEIDEDELGIEVEEEEEVEIEMEEVEDDDDDEDNDKDCYEREDLEGQDRTDGEESLSQISGNQSEALREISLGKATASVTTETAVSVSEGKAGAANGGTSGGSGSTAEASIPNIEIKIPRGRGRPPRNANRTDIGPSGLVSITSIWAGDDKPKGKRGRPRLRPIIETEKVKVETLSKPYKVKRPKGPNYILLDIIHRLYKRDKQQIFAEPVNAEFVPDYYQVIKNPMDFSTMRKKVLNNEYSDFESFNSDIRLIISNCYTYNRVGTMVYRMGLILEETWDKSIEGSKSRYEQSIINIKEHEEKKSAGEIISDSESETQPVWDKTPTSPPTGDSSNRRSMITRRMEARLSGQNNNTQWIGGSGKYGDNRTDSSIASDIIGRRPNSNYSNLGGSSLNQKLSGGIGINNFGKNYLQHQQPKGPTLASICMGGGSSLKEALEKLKVDRFEPFNTLLRQMSTQPCIKTPTIDDWYVFDKQLSSIQYRNSVRRFIGEESIQALRKIMDIGTALLEIDPHPEIARTPLSDLRLFGIDTEDFASFNQNLTVDSTFLLGVGENHIKLALSLQDEHPEIDLSPLKELYIKYTKGPVQQSIHTTPPPSLHTPPPSINTPPSSLSSSSLQKQPQSQQLLMQHQQSSSSLNSSSTSQIVVGSNSQMSHHSIHTGAINKNLPGGYGNAVGMNPAQKNLNPSIYNGVYDHSNQAHSHNHIGSFSSQNDIQQMASSSLSPSNSTSNVIQDTVFESRNQGLIRTVVSPQNAQTQIKMQINNGFGSGLNNSINNRTINSSSNGYYDAMGVPHKIQKTESSQNMGLRPLSNTSGGISTNGIAINNSSSSSGLVTTYSNNSVSGTNISSIGSNSIDNLSGIQSVKQGGMNVNKPGIGYNSCASNSTSSLSGSNNGGRYYGNDFNKIPERTSYSQSSIGAPYQHEGHIQNQNNVSHIRYQQIIHQNNQYHSNNVFLNGNSESNILDGNNNVIIGKSGNGCDNSGASAVSISGSNVSNNNINDGSVAGGDSCININGTNIVYGNYQNGFLYGNETANVHGIRNDISESSARGSINKFGIYQQQNRHNMAHKQPKQSHHININIGDNGNDNAGGQQHGNGNSIHPLQQQSQHSVHNAQNHHMRQIGIYQYPTQTQVNQQSAQYVPRYNNIQTGSAIQSNKVIHSNAPLHNNGSSTSHVSGIGTPFISNNN
ncbi:hypothetical protein FG386_001312 [Cryptosporidium ryanae]|uniref:uncharacterized protein n=1 Tax=Cryptosporidium ryanae TaxID=515981 RepID=UPI00351A3C83|nr:hypothetical protein FG386_001312 [Cryptosporidium ryanae]